jgi:hypothetical protein
MAITAPPAGYEGTVTLSGVSFRAVSATVSEVVDVNDATGIGNRQRINIPGVSVLQITAAGYSSAGIGAVPTAGTGTFTFTNKDGNTGGYSGTIVYSGITYSKDVNNNDTFRVAGVSTGSYNVLVN